MMSQFCNSCFEMNSKFVWNVSFIISRFRLNHRRGTKKKCNVVCLVCFFVRLSEGVCGGTTQAVLKLDRNK